MKIQYSSIPMFDQVYLENSFVLEITEGTDFIVVSLETVLREHHPKYSTPKPGEKYCYQKGKIVFGRIKKYSWLEKIMKPIKGIDGEIDYGNIDWFYEEDEHYRIGGEWGELDIVADEIKFKLNE